MKTAKEKALEIAQLMIDFKGENKTEKRFQAMKRNS